MSSAQYRVRGFTLLEVMISILVMTIGIVGLLGMQLTAIRANAFAREMEEANQLCQAKVEQLRALPLPLPDPAGPELLDARGCQVLGDTRAYCSQPLPGTRYTRTWTKDATQPDHYSVQVQWPGQDGKTHQMVVSDVR